MSPPKGHNGPFIPHLVTCQPQNPGRESEGLLLSGAPLFILSLHPPFLGGMSARTTTQQCPLEPYNSS